MPCTWDIISHWSHRREMGEHQHTANYYRAFVDYLNRFTFGRGVHFGSPKETEAIVPEVLRRVWNVDNNQEKILLEMGQIGGVTGDCFVKVAYEQPWEDSVGRVHPGKVRILPLNSSFIFPEWHPHDRTRLIRCKIKYRFWACVDTKTEALTREGWKRYDELTTADEILVLDPDTDEIHWRPVDAVNVYDYEGHMVAWGDRVNAVSTPNHRWLVEQQRGRGDTLRYERKIARTELPIDGDPAVSALRNGSRVVVGGGTPMAFADAPKWSDEAVETLAWYLTEGWDHTNQTNAKSIYLAQKRDDMVARIRRLAAHWQAEGATFSEYAPKSDGVITWYLGKGVKEAMWEMAPGKQITPEFLTSLTYAQAVSFYNTLLDGDGSRSNGGKNTVRWTQLDEGRQDGFQMLCAMLGKRTSKTADGEKVQEYQSRYVGTEYLNERRVYLEDGKVWCPTVEGGIWFARREGNTYWTGNTSLEGTRQVMTYTEILTDDVVEEYLNDELIDSRPNPLGVIPVVHIPNMPVSGSPWGISDCQDIISINRQFNEISTDVADIINYHAAPVTVITGAKASQLEKGAKKVWAGLPKDASVFNLEGGSSGLQWALQYLETLKRTMHEMVGIPETALGQIQPISNTSGVALSIQFQPLMNRWQQKVAQYTDGLQKINELILMTLATNEPDALIWNPTEDMPLEPDQIPVLNLQDPISFQTTVVFPPPLPLDKLVVLNEIQAKMSLGLESREGALRILGEEFPDEKLAEIRAELIEDAKTDGALDLVKTMIANEIAALTGSYPPENAPMPAPPPQPVDITGDGVPDVMAGPGVTQDPDAQLAEEEIRNSLLTFAYGTKAPQRRNPDNTQSD